MSTHSAARTHLPHPDDRNAVNRDAEDIERVTSNKRIDWILKQLMKKRELLTITLAGDTEEYTSAIVDVCSGDNTLLLDELVPHGGNRLIASKRCFRTTCRLDGITVDFDTSLVKADKQDGMICYTANFPDLIYYQQRRDFHRVRLPLSNPPRVTLLATGDHSEEGQLRDISLGGAQIILPPGASLAQGAMYECAFALPTGDTIYSCVEVCYASVFGSRDEVRAGIRFLDLTTVQKRISERSVITIEQELRKRLAR